MKIFVRDKDTTTEHFFPQSDTYTPSGNEEQVTDIVEFERAGKIIIDSSIQYGRDKKSLREGLKTLVYTKMQIAVPADVENQAKWDLLTAEEKSIAAHWFLVGKDAFQLEVNNNDKYWTIQAANYRHWTMEDRSYRLKLMESLVFRRVLNLQDAKQILADMTQLTKDTAIEIDDVTHLLTSKVRVSRLTRMYIEGLESEEDDGVAALKDYIDSTSGTPFETNGFRNLAYSFRTGHTANSVADELIEIIDSVW